MKKGGGKEDERWKEKSSFFILLPFFFFIFITPPFAKKCLIFPLRNFSLPAGFKCSSLWLSPRSPLTWSDSCLNPVPGPSLLAQTPSPPSRAMLNLINGTSSSWDKTLTQEKSLLLALLSMTEPSRRFLGFFLIFFFFFSVTVKLNLIFLFDFDCLIYEVDW